MEIHSLFSALEHVLHQHAGMGYFVDLLLKSLFVLVLMFSAHLVTRRLAASLRHLVWCVGFMSLFILPLFIGLLPKIQVPIATDDVMIAENTMTRGLVSMADNMELVTGAWWEAFLGVYFTLLGIQLSYILLGLCKVFSLSREARPLENPLVRRELDTLVMEEGLTLAVGLAKSREVFSPVSWGLFSPQIILPEQAERWDTMKIRNVLIHEISHIQRLDWLTSLVVKITRSIYWYNPLIWIAARKLEEEAEQACDDAVILNGHCHNEYASNLLEIARHARLGNLGGTLVQAIAGSFLGSRVFSILDKDRQRQNTEVAWVVRGLLLGSTAIAILASLRLVPLANVTSIDPRANTAFSVMFIPQTEASTFTDLEKDSDEREEQPYGWSRLRISQKILAANSTDPAGAENVEASRQEKTAAGDAGADEESSLLEDYISATGMDDQPLQFEQYVEDYTNGIIRDVQSNIDLESFTHSGIEAGKDIDEATLIAVKKIMPDYPWRARQRGIEGYSVVEYAIDSQGKVKDPIIVESSPGKVFNRSSLKAIEQYIFEPPTVNGEVVSLEGLQTRFVYQLKPG